MTQNVFFILEQRIASSIGHIHSFFIIIWGILVIFFEIAVEDGEEPQVASDVGTAGLVCLVPNT